MTSNREQGLPELSRGELKRFLRHLSLAEVGEEGQRKLKAARVLLVGAGGLGSPASLYLAAAGVGNLGIVDYDVVDETNLQRQVLHGTSGIGTSKLESAQKRLQDLNPHVRIECFETRLTSENALEIIGGYDVLVDGSDNFATRYLGNDACVLTGIPYVYGAVFRFEGQASVFATPDGPCYRCLFQEPPPHGLVPTCAESGILGVVPGIIGSIQALEAVKLVLDRGESLAGRLLLFDALELRFRELELHRDPNCPICGEHPTIKQLIDYEAFCGAGATDSAHMEISVVDLADRVRGESPPILVDVREPYEWKISRIEDSVHIPLANLRDRVSELDPGRQIVTVCHHGIRSLLALEILKAEGIDDVRSLKGGLEAWSLEVDPCVERY